MASFERINLSEVHFTPSLLHCIPELRLSCTVAALWPGAPVWRLPNHLAFCAACGTNGFRMSGVKGLR
jgi:hypothetical protein